MNNYIFIIFLSIICPCDLNSIDKFIISVIKIIAISRKKTSLQLSKANFLRVVSRQSKFNKFIFTFTLIIAYNIRNGPEK